jgi:crossover junction endodeoxyribonuclease RuvC
VLGCDPGLTGALALISFGQARPTDREFLVRDMPVVRLRVGKATKATIEPATLADLVRELRPDLAAVERVHAMPGQGVSSMFSFGTSYGMILGVLAALAVPVTLLTPQEWGRIVRLPRGPDASRQRCTQFFPQHAAQFARKGDHGRSDAALIAMAGARVAGVI